MSVDAIAAPRPDAGVAAGQPLISFAAHQVRAGDHGAREDFETMIGQLVRAVRPGARMIAANPGDWGIDVLFGDLGGSVAVWQSKYFYPLVGKGQQQQIRESFDSAFEHAAANGYVIEQWTLCVASSLDGETAKWWDNWKRKKQREKKVTIDLWDETELRGLLISPDADDVRRHYYERATAIPASIPSPRALVDVDATNEELLDSALFVRQLHAAGHAEVSAAKHQFFNAEILAREVVDKGVPSEIAALASADSSVHEIWEESFNDACIGHSEELLPGLHRSVMAEIRSNHGPLTSGLPCSPTHACGLMHRVVDDRRAGWVRGWRNVVVVAAGQEQPDKSPLENLSDGSENESGQGER